MIPTLTPRKVKSLGPYSRFMRLAELAALHRQWRKVAKLISKANFFAKIDGRDMYIIGALMNTKFHPDIFNEISLIFNLANFDKRVKQG
jgi:hypothetical protein